MYIYAMYIYAMYIYIHTSGILWKENVQRRELLCRSCMGFYAMYMYIHTCGILWKENVRIAPGTVGSCAREHRLQLLINPLRPPIHSVEVVQLHA